METSRKALFLATSVCLLALAGCGGGGGGGGITPATTTPVTTTPVTTTPVTTTPVTPTVPTVSIAAPTSLGTGGFGGQGTNFTTNPPPIGYSFLLPGLTGHITPTVVDGPVNRDGTAIFRGTVTSGGVVYPVFDLSIPTLSVNAPNVRGDGTPVTVSNGQVSAAAASMTYTLLGVWTFVPTAGGESYIGQTATGFVTPQAGLPATGSATYAGRSNVVGGGGVVGAYFVPSGTGTIQGGTVAGNVDLTANFAANTLSGSFNNMTATPAGSSTSTPWNTVNISGTLDRASPGTATSVFFKGQTTTGAAPANAGLAGFSSAASGSVNGGFFGPGAQEIGGVWTLAETPSTNGKAAFGTFGAK